MCGIAGFLTNNDNTQKNEGLLKGFLSPLCDHRGPDSHDNFRSHPVYLAHARLKIIDLSENGKQPMPSYDKRFTLTYNGEIYNFAEIKTLLGAGVPFRGHSDTEVLVNAFTVLGVRETLLKARGMFALAVADHQEKKLILARDRFGEKPLYYGFIGEDFVFSSELKSFFRHEKWRPKISAQALNLYFERGYVPAPFSIFENIGKVMPGEIIEVPFEKPQDLTQDFYWHTRELAELPKITLSEAESLKILDTQLQETLSLYSYSDVAMGSFLSGGIDSSIVSLYAQKVSSQKIKTFNIGFENKNYDESQKAEKVAKIIGTEHHTLKCQDSDMLAMVNEIPSAYDEPFSDSSQLPTLMVSRLAREHVTVALSGDGGDEVFGGYNRHIHANQINRWHRLPPSFKKFLWLMSSSFEKDNSFGQKLLSVALRKQGFSYPSDKISKWRKVLKSQSTASLYRALNSLNFPLDFSNTELATFFPKLSTTELFMLKDLEDYLPNDIFTKVDKASMRFSLETRAPLLDPKIVEWSWRNPIDYKVRDGIGKLPLRRLLAQHLPNELLHAPKQGFTVPLADWLRNELKFKVLELSNFPLLPCGPNAALIQRMSDEHLSGRKNWHYELWNLIVLNDWLKKYMSAA